MDPDFGLLQNVYLKYFRYRQNNEVDIPRFEMGLTPSHEPLYSVEEVEDTFRYMVKEAVSIQESYHNLEKKGDLPLLYELASELIVISKKKEKDNV